MFERNRFHAVPALLGAAIALLAFLSTALAVDFGRTPAEVKQLENGLTVIAIPDRRAPVVTHMIWYRVGSADEPRGKSGIAHFLEHLMFKGTKNTPIGEFSRKVAEIGGQENAFTSYDYTAYYQKVSPEALEMVMGYEADRMRNLVLTEEAVETEKKVILEERRSRVEQSPSAILSESADAMLFKHHPYGTPIIGWEDEMLALTLDDAIAFYDRYYAPNNAVLVVAGDVDPATVFDLAQKAYGVIPARPDAAPDPRVAEPEPRVAKRVEYADERVSDASFSRAYLVPSYQTAEGNEAAALDLLAAILGGSPTARLYTGLVAGEETALSAGSWYQGGARDMTHFTVYGTPRGETTVEALEAQVDAAINNLIENGVTQQELDRQRNALLKSVIFERDSQVTLARIYGVVFTLGGDLSEIDDWPTRLQEVTVDDVNAVARKYLKKTRSVTSVLRPKS